MLTLINFTARICFLISGCLFWQQVSGRSKTLGSVWQLWEKMLLMPVGLGSGMVSSWLIVPHSVLFFRLF